MCDRHISRGFSPRCSPEPSLLPTVELCFQLLSSGIAFEGMRLFNIEARESAIETACVSI
jgi:hypothetical protein